MATMTMTSKADVFDSIVSVIIVYGEFYELLCTLAQCK